MKKILLLMLGCSLIFTPSCKDYLQKDPTSSLSEAVFWKSKSDFNMALIGIYSYLKGNGNYYNQTTNSYNYCYYSTLIPLFENLSDNSVGGSSNDQVEEILKDATTPSTGGFISKLYAYCYSGITRVNIFLERLDLAKDNLAEADYKQFKGEALAIRAMFYHYLYTCYGEVPIVKEALTVENMYKEKSDREAVYKAVVDDYDDAIALLPDGVSYYQSGGHMTKYAAIALRARTKLYHAYKEDGNVISSAEMATILTELNQIPDGIYEVEADPLTNFHSSKQEESKEIMFSTKFLKPTMRNQVDYYCGDDKRVAPTRDLVYAFPTVNGEKYTPDSNIENKMYDPKISAKERYELFAKIFENRDPRLAKYISHNNVYDFSEYITTAPADSSTGTKISTTYFDVYKLVTPKTNAQNWGYNWEGDQDVVIMRWGVVLLMKAEAAFESGDKTAAMGYINDLRAARNIKAITDLDKTALHNEIRIETCFEGQRYFDLKRWRELGKMNDKVRDPSQPEGFKVVINPNHFDWPIPLSEIQKATEHGVNLVQNPGYTSAE